MAAETVSALLPVHGGVDPDHLRQAAQSLVLQTRPLDEIVLVEDGPLSADHLRVIDWLRSHHSNVERVRFALNRGAGVANQAGLLAASSQWVMKADADDISVPERLAKELVAVRQTGAVACGSAMLEFTGEPSSPVALRTAPLSNEQIRRRMGWNNPMNHPTVLYRREVAVGVGGYPPWRYMQDYGLFARIQGAGPMMNLPDPLVLFRAGTGRTNRRRTTEVRRLELDLQWELCHLGIVGPGHAAFNVLWRSAYRLMPARWVEVAQHRLLAGRVPRALAHQASRPGTGCES